MRLLAVVACVPETIRLCSHPLNVCRRRCVTHALVGTISMMWTTARSAATSRTQRSESRACLLSRTWLFAQLVSSRITIPCNCNPPHFAPSDTSKPAACGPAATCHASFSATLPLPTAEPRTHVTTPSSTATKLPRHWQSPSVPRRRRRPSRAWLRHRAPHQTSEWQVRRDVRVLQ